jgi:hypothetical protein
MLLLGIALGAVALGVGIGSVFTMNTRPRTAVTLVIGATVLALAAAVILAL